jgi:hypothetical protein
MVLLSTLNDKERCALIYKKPPSRQGGSIDIRFDDADIHADISFPG